MSDMEIFRFEGNNVRTIYKNNQIWFCLKDVCDILEINNVSQIRTRLNKRYVITNDVPHPQSPTKIIKMLFINESNLYKVIFQSRKPEAEQFSDWVTGEILPTIRKYGAYLTEQKIEEVLSDPDTIIRLATDLKMEQNKKRALENTLIREQPKIDFANSVSASKTSILIGEFAKILKQNGIDIGEKRLFTWLRENNYLVSRNAEDYNMPTQYSMNLQLFEIKETVIYVNGCPRVCKTTKITGKGQIYFIKKFKKLSESYI